MAWEKKNTLEQALSINDAVQSFFIKPAPIIKWAIFYSDEGVFQF